MDSKKSPKVAKSRHCEICNYTCCKESDYTKHLLTSKHKRSYTGVTMDYKMSPKVAEEFECECGNRYKYRQGLYKHQQKCFIHQDMITNQITTKSPTLEIDKEMLIQLLLKNQDVMENVLLKNQDVMEKMIEIMPNIGNTNHSNNTNSNNNFNIQMFLNDHCKNAMNLTDFIDSLPITAETYDNTIQNGLTKTITNMITNGLSQLDILDRPIHCTDATRKTLYVKEANNWEKDTELIRILLGIKTIARKQRTMINKWQDANEGWEKEDNIQTKMTTLICNSMTDIENDEKETSKIIRSISKKVYLDNETKQQYLN